jgi:hypothetical protein
MLFMDQGPAWVADAADRLGAGLTPDDRATLTGMRPVRVGAALLRLDVDRAAAELRECLAESMEYGRMGWKHQEAEGLLLAVSLGTGDLATVQASSMMRLPGSTSRSIASTATSTCMPRCARTGWPASTESSSRAHDRLLVAHPRDGQMADAVVRASPRGCWHESTTGPRRSRGTT